MRLDRTGLLCGAVSSDKRCTHLIYYCDKTKLLRGGDNTVVGFIAITEAVNK